MNVIYLMLFNSNFNSEWDVFLLSKSVASMPDDAVA